MNNFESQGKGLGCTLGQTQSSLPVAGVPMDGSWPRVRPKGCGSSPREVTPWAVGQPRAQTKAASGWDKEALGQKHQHIHYIPSPHPGAAVGKMISWGFYLLFLLCDQCTSLCCCSRGSQACVRSVIYGVLLNRSRLIGAVFPKGWEGPQHREPGGKTKSKRVSNVRNKQFPSTQREGSSAGG